MARLSFRGGVIASIIVGIALVAAPGRAQDIAPAVPAVQVAPNPMLARLSADPRTPEGYTANLELHVKMRSFPFLGLTVHGTSSYKRPGAYHYVLANVPRIAGKFDDLHYDLGDPLTWAQKNDISMAPDSTDDVPVVRLTPKHPGLVTALDITMDARHERMLKATWRRKDGGTIVLTQTYTAVGQADVVTLQHATIDIPHMRAELTATYTNVTVDQPTFAGIPER